MELEDVFVVDFLEDFDFVFEHGFEDTLNRFFLDLLDGHHFLRVNVVALVDVAELARANLLILRNESIVSNHFFVDH